MCTVPCEARYVPVAQLDSALDSDSKGRRFESCRAYQNKRHPWGCLLFWRRRNSTSDLRLWGNDFIEKIAQGFFHAAGRVDGSNHHAVTVNSGKVQLIPGPLC